MAKGDHRAAMNKSDEQQKMAQTYLTGTQQNIGNQYGANNSLYWGGQGAPQYGNTFGVGSTVPNYNQYGQPIYQGNGTDTPSMSQPGTAFSPTGGFGGIPGNPGQTGGQQSGGGGNLQAQFNALFPGDTLSSADLIAHEGDLTKMGVRLMGPNAAGMRTKLMLPDGSTVDLIGGAGAGGGTGRKQWLVQGGGGGGGGSMGQYGPGGIPGMAMGDYAGLQGMYGNMVGAAADMARTGGLSEADKANLRARAISPIRSVYSQGLQNVERQKALQGGYAPGFTTAMGRFNRQEGQATSDATTNAEAAIAQMVQQGKISGLGLWGQGLGGMSSLYGTQPGMAKFFGDQLQAQMENQLRASQLQNQLGLGVMGNMTDIGARVPGNMASTLGPLGDFIGKAGSGIGGGIYGATGGAGI